jgi:hypothetical protein
VAHLGELLGDLTKAATLAGPAGLGKVLGHAHHGAAQLMVPLPALAVLAALALPGPPELRNPSWPSNSATAPSHLANEL